MKKLIILFCLMLLADAALAGYNVVVHVNYPKDTVFIGVSNFLEVWIENDDSIWGMSLGFECSNYSGTVDWDQNYGNNPPFNKENDAANAFTDFLYNLRSWDDLALPDSMLMGGIYIQPNGSPLLPHSLRRCYTLKFKIPAGQPLGSFCVDNIFFPPAGIWEFYGDHSNRIVPNYNGCVNQSVANPDCPAVCFPMAVIDYICGDADGDGEVNVVDMVFLMNYIFMAGPAPYPYDAGDTNCSGRVNIGDVGYLIEYIFAAGPQPCANCP